jgi:HAMP domain-containing protein
VLPNDTEDVQIMTPQRTIFLSLRLKMLLSYTLVFGLVFASAFWWFYLSSTASATEYLRTHVKTYLAATALGINGDDFEKLSHLPPGAIPNSEVYRKQQAWLAHLHSIEPNELSYTDTRGKRSNEVLIVGDALRESDPKRASIFMEVYDEAKSRLRHSSGDSFISFTPYHNKWGYWVSGYTPIYNSTHQVVGHIGVDFSAKYVLDVQQQIRNRIWLVFFLSSLVVVTFVYFYSPVLAHPIDQLTRMVSRVSTGDYRDSFASFGHSRLRDEITILSAAFAGMVEQVKSREHTLQREVQVLRIEIDSVRKAKQVNEIVETDSFRDLKSKAKEMRSRAQRAVGTETLPSSSG